MENRKPIGHIAAGLLIAGILILFTLLMSAVMGASASPGNGLWNYLVIAIGLAIFVNLYGKANHYKVSFGDLFSYGFKATAVIVLVFVGFMIILSLAYPELKEKALEATKAEMEKNTKFSADDVNKSVNMVSQYFWVFAIGATVLAFVVTGAVGSLIGAMITKKIPPPPPSSTTDELRP